MADDWLLLPDKPGYELSGLDACTTFPSRHRLLRVTFITGRLLPERRRRTRDISRRPNERSQAFIKMG
jgi:hypothetical protein